MIVQNMGKFINKFNIYLDLEAFEKFYIKDFKDDMRYNDFRKYLEDLLIQYNEYSKFILNDDNEREWDRSSEEMELIIKTFEPNKNLFNIYLEKDHWTSEEFKKLNTLNREEQKKMILNKNESVFYSFLHMNLEDIVNYIESELFKLEDLKNPVKNIDEKPNKINSKITNIQAIGYLFTELINKGLIEPKRKNGKISPLNISRMILDHFYFEDLEEQPNEEDLRKALFNDNKLSSDKISLFKLPSIKQLNQ